MRLTTFASGSSGNCALLRLDGTNLLLDAGISWKRICGHLRLSGVAPEALSAVLITHAHSDHICGLATLVKRCSAPILAPAVVASQLRRSVAGIEARLRVTEPGESIELEGLCLRCFPTPHDTPESVGWRVTGSEVFALATDMGCVTEDIRRGLLGADAVLIEANHDVDRLRYGPYPASLKRRVLSDHGHLSNDDCARLAAELASGGTKYIILGHLSRENNTPALALSTVSAALGGTEGLFVAPADERLTLETGEEAALCSP